MVTQRAIESILVEALKPTHLDVINESGQHSVPKGSETHFKVTVVSEEFAAKRSVARHQRIYALLDAQLKAGVHALALHTYTPQEWEARNAAPPDSPACLGGSQ